MKSRLPSIQSIEAFLRLAGGANIVTVAQELNLTPSAISRRIQNLEEVIGAPLLDRSSSRLALTPAGSVYAAKLRPIIADLREAGNLVRPQPDDFRLRILSNPSIYANWLAPRLGRFLESWPHARIELMTSHAQNQATPDITIRARSTNIARPGEQKLLDFEVTPCCVPGLAERNGIATPADLLRGPLLEHVSAGHVWARWFQCAGVEEHGSARRLVVDSSFMIYEGAINGIGFAPLPRIYVHLREDKRLITPFPELHAFIGSAFISGIKSSSRPIVRAFHEWILNEIVV